MRKNEECRLIQDLLPNYIEGLTSDETNTYIENHIKDCKECTRILKNMGEEVVLDKIDDMKKIDYLKKIKHRNKTIIGIVLSVSIILIIFIISFFTSIGGVPIDENGKPEYFETFKQWITGKNNITTSEVTNLLLISNDNELEATIIMTFDKSDICIGARYCVGGYTEKEALKKHEELRNVESQQIPTITNVKIVENKIIYNYNYWNGKSKEEIKGELSKDYNYIIYEM